MLLKLPHDAAAMMLFASAADADTAALRQTPMMITPHFRNSR